MPRWRRRSIERYDIARAGRDLENTQTTIEFLDNQRLPDVRLETSYRGNGLAGTQFLRGGGFPGSVIGTRNRGFGDALGQVFSNDYPTWSFGLTVSYPIGRSFEDASLARARGRAAADHAAHRQPAHRGGRDRPPGRAAGAQHRRTRRGGARRRVAGAGTA